MALSYYWRPSLPQAPQKGYTEDIGVNVLRTPMDSGISKIRRRGKKPSILNCTFLMTGYQVSELEDFVTEDLKGVLRFGFVHPRTQITEECRIVPQNDGVMYKLSYAAPDYYSVSIQFEILP